VALDFGIIVLRLGHPNILWSEQFPRADNRAVRRNLKRLQPLPQKGEFTYYSLSETRPYSSSRVYSWAMETIGTIFCGVLVAVCLLGIGLLMFKPYK
jgi:hypothetical protein